jgi:predicted Rossmann-fold nucleotide-binding protein
MGFIFDDHSVTSGGKGGLMGACAQHTAYENAQIRETALMAVCSLHSPVKLEPPGDGGL